MSGDSSSSAPTRLWIRGGRVYVPGADPHRPPVADIVVDGSTIAWVGEADQADLADLPAPPGIRTIEMDASGKLVMPGFVNAHYHSHDLLAKGLFEELPLEIWGLYSLPDNYSSLTIADVRARTLLGALECVRNGITTVQDMLSLFPEEDAYLDAVLDAYDDIGLRVVLSLQISDLSTTGLGSLLARHRACRSRLGNCACSAKRGVAVGPRGDAAQDPGDEPSPIELGARTVGTAALHTRTAGGDCRPGRTLPVAGVHASLRNQATSRAGSAAIRESRRLPRPVSWGNGPTRAAPHRSPCHMADTPGNGASRGSASGCGSQSGGKHEAQERDPRHRGTA